MNFKSLLEKYNSQEVFIHGNSVIQIVDMKTYSDSGDLKTDFIYHTERNRRGIITIVHQDNESKNTALYLNKKTQLKNNNL